MSQRILVLGSATILLAAVIACGSNRASTSSTSTGSNTTSTSSGGGAGTGGQSSGFMGHGNVKSLAVSPPTQTIDVQNSAPASASFQAIATYDDGFQGPVAAMWSFDTLTIALADQTGKVTANGSLGGHGTLKATLGSLSGTADVTVLLHVTQNPANLSPGDQAKFGSPDTNPSGTLLYPYDQTVFPRGLLAPELQWANGTAGDSYRVHLSEKFLDATFFVTADPPSRFQIPNDVWTALTQSNAGETVALDIERLSGGVAHAAMHENWKIAQGSLRGTIYYWSVNTGQLQRIAPGASSPTVVFDSGAADQLGTPAPAAYNGTMPPWETGGNNKRCVACHTVSKDGSTIAAVFEKKGSTASPWGTIDLTANPPSVTQITPYTSTAIYLGLSPDGKYVVDNDLNLTMHMADAKTGATIPSALDSFADKVADPAFSPDGHSFAFSSNVSGYYPVEFYRSDLDVMDFDGMGGLTNRRTVVHGGSNEIAFASFSPDSKWLFYQEGDYSRAKYGTSSVGHNDLFVADLAGQVGGLPLANASGASLEARNQHISYQPTVNPIAVGGYTWVVFVSPRDYGNRMQSTSNPTYENRKQLWVAAVDSTPQAGTDPSHPAFWLPGQDLTTINMSGYWALEACQQMGASCDQGFECCSGFCRDDGMGHFSCVPPPSGCAQIGDKCTTDGDCCNTPAVKCIGGFCATSGPPM